MVKPILTLEEIKKVIADSTVRALVESCAVAEPGELGACVQDRLLARLTELFAESLDPGPAPIAMPMARWLAEDPNPDSADACRPCALPVAVDWYQSELKDRGRPELAVELVGKALSADAPSTARMMDDIKSKVDSELRKRLEEFDAATQANVG